MFLLYILLGVIAGTLAGLFGIGGGLVLVPLLVWSFEQQGFAPELVMLMAVATSLATIIVTSLASIFAHHRAGMVVWSTVKRLVPGILFGAVLGAVIADSLSSELFRRVFIGYLFIVTLQMLRSASHRTQKFTNNRLVHGFAGLVIGLVSSVLGIGGGTLTVPFLFYTGQVMGRSVGTSAACGFPIAVFGALSYVLLGWGAVGLPKWCLGYIYIPAFVGIISTSVIFAPIGAKFAHRLPTKKLKRIFALLLFAVGVKLVW